MSRFSLQAGEALQFARIEAQLLQSNYVDSGHLLLGLLRQDTTNPAVPLFFAQGVSLARARSALGEMDERAETLARFTPGARQAIHLAADLAQKRQEPIEASDCLRALLLLPENQAIWVLHHLGVNLEELYAQMHHAFPSEDASATSPPARIDFQAHQRDKFTQRARRALSRAEEEAWIFEQSIDIEHLLLGLLYDNEGVAFCILKELRVDLDAIDRTFAQLFSQREGGSLLLTQRGKHSIELAVKEAVHFGHRYLGTEHLLLGILHLFAEEHAGGGLFSGLVRKRATGDPAASLLASQGLSLKQARRQLSALLATGMNDDATI
ncbi:MAG TPA: Clp protease N-terminal domain-containing protein [Ktedonobacteraceae bacterium]